MVNKETKIIARIEHPTSRIVKDEIEKLPEMTAFAFSPCRQQFWSRKMQRNMHRPSSSTYANISRNGSVT